MKIPRKMWVWTAIALALVFVAIQFAPVDHSNPAIQTQVPASAEARAVLKRACYDCHSNQTRWPWYTYVAPVSWLIAKDVREGRMQLNYSTWNKLTPAEQAEVFKESWEKVQSGEMPLGIYVPLHPEAKLSPADRAILKAWADSSGAGGDPGSAGAGSSGTSTFSGSGATDAGTAGTGAGALPNGTTGTNTGGSETAPSSGSGVDGTLGTSGAAGSSSAAGAGVTGGEATGGGERRGDGDGDRDGDDD